jgi:hypothetical protein
MTMIGSYARNFTEGRRSEILADYLFSAWGTVTPVRANNDYGVDLYCTFAEMIGLRAVVREYFVVQVKSENKPWSFEHPESVEWLVTYPSPLFLAVVDKKNHILCVYHVMARFFVWAHGELPKTLELVPGDGDTGKFLEWDEGGKISLQAPILRVELSDLMEAEKINHMRTVFEQWLTMERENCDLVRRGLPRFRMPGEYHTNEVPNKSIVEVGAKKADRQFVERGIVGLAESAECLGGVLGNFGDFKMSLRAGLLARHLLTTYPDAFAPHLRWQNGISGDLASFVGEGLNSLIAQRAQPNYRFEGLDAVDQALAENDLAKRFEKGAG